VPADFEAGPVRDVLGAAGFDWARPAMFCWTGVAPYLTAQAIELSDGTGDRVDVAHDRGGCSRV
jgi:Leucine carboxyl methyltransferase